MRVLLGVMVMGALGAAARYLLDGYLSDRMGSSFPWGIMIINVSGSFAIGLVYASLTSRSVLDPSLRVWVTTGFIGAYTTFSTVSLETAQLVQQQSYALAFANSAGSLAAGIVAAGLGLALGTSI